MCIRRRGRGRKNDLTLHIPNSNFPLRNEPGLVVFTPKSESHTRNFTREFLDSGNTMARFGHKEIDQPLSNIRAKGTRGKIPTLNIHRQWRRWYRQHKKKKRMQKELKGQRSHRMGDPKTNYNRMGDKLNHTRMGDQMNKKTRSKYGRMINLTDHKNQKRLANSPTEGRLAGHQNVQPSLTLYRHIFLYNPIRLSPVSLCVKSL